MGHIFDTFGTHFGALWGSKMIKIDTKNNNKKQGRFLDALGGGGVCAPFFQIDESNPWRGVLWMGLDGGNGGELFFEFSRLHQHLHASRHKASADFFIALPPSLLLTS